MYYLISGPPGPVPGSYPFGIIFGIPPFPDLRSGIRIRDLSMHLFRDLIYEENNVGDYVLLDSHF
jgi:hypothetical protein